MFLKDGVHAQQSSKKEPFIPRRLWQTCKDKTSIHPQLQNCIDKLRQMNPDWEYRLFDNSDCDAFVHTIGSDRLISAYERINPKHGAAKGDLFRYLVVYMYGGAYLDLKSGVSKPLTSILKRHDKYIISNWDNGPNGKFPGAGMGKPFHKKPGGEYENWLIISEPGHPYLAITIERVITNIEEFNALKFNAGTRGVLNVTGPVAYTFAVMSCPTEEGTRKIISAQEGIHYTCLDSWDTHRSLQDGHYSFVSQSPVLPRGLQGSALVKYWLAEMLIWPYSQLRALNHRRLRARQHRMNDT